MADETEGIRRVAQVFINEGVVEPHGETWTTEQLTEAFDVEGFLAPFVVVRRKADGVRGSLAFRHNPRIYFGFRPDR